MMKVALACLVCHLTVCQVAAILDGPALIQRELKVSQPPAFRISPKTMVQKAVFTFDKKLEDYVQQHESDLNKTRSMIDFAEKYVSRMSPQFVQQPHSNMDAVFADLSNEVDADISVQLLRNLRDPVFLNAARKGLNDISKNVKTFSLRTEKRVTDLILASETMPQAQLAEQVSAFFEKEIHIINSVVETLANSFTGILTASPGYEAVVGDIARPLVDRFKNYTASRLDNMYHSYVDSKGSSFCESPLVEFTREYIPVLEHIKDKVPLIEAFAQAKVADVATVASELIRNFAKSMTSLAARLREDIRLSAKKICAVIGVPVGGTAGPVEKPAEDLTEEEEMS